MVFCLKKRLNEKQHSYKFHSFVQILLYDKELFYPIYFMTPFKY